MHIITRGQLRFSLLIAFYYANWILAMNFSCQTSTKHETISFRNIFVCLKLQVYSPKLIDWRLVDVTTYVAWWSMMKRKWVKLPSIGQLEWRELKAEQRRCHLFCIAGFHCHVQRRIGGASCVVVFLRLHDICPSVELALVSHAEYVFSSCYMCVTLTQVTETIAQHRIIYIIRYLLIIWRFIVCRSKIKQFTACYYY